MAKVVVPTQDILRGSSLRDSGGATGPMTLSTRQDTDSILQSISPSPRGRSCAAIGPHLDPRACFAEADHHTDRFATLLWVYQRGEFFTLVWGKPNQEKTLMLATNHHKPGLADEHFPWEALKDGGDAALSSRVRVSLLIYVSRMRKQRESQGGTRKEAGEMQHEAREQGGTRAGVAPGRFGLGLGLKAVAVYLVPQCLGKRDFTYFPD